MLLRQIKKELNRQQRRYVCFLTHPHQCCRFRECNRLAPLKHPRVHLRLHQSKHLQVHHLDVVPKKGKNLRLERRQPTAKIQLGGDVQISCAKNTAYAKNFLYLAACNAASISAHKSSTSSQPTERRINDSGTLALSIGQRRRRSQSDSTPPKLVA